MRVQLFILFLLLWCLNSLGQQQLFEQLTKKNGLGSNNVYDIEITSSGDVWVSTDQHLCNFQGLSFASYAANDSSLTQLVIDPLGTPRAYSSNGTEYYYDGIRLNKSTSRLEEIAQTDLLNELTYTSKNTFWLSTVVKGNLLKISSDTLETQPLPSKSAYFVKELDNGQFICGTGGNPTENNLLYLLLSKDTITIPLTRTDAGSKSSFIVLNDGSFLFAKDFELIHFTREEVIQRVFVEKNITTLYQDSKDKIWIGLFDGGMLCYRNNNITSNSTISYLGSNSITSIVEDLSNNLWVGTLGNGVFYLPAQQSIKYKAPLLFSDTSNIIEQKVGIKSDGLSDVSNSSELRVISTQSNIYDSIPPSIYISNLQIMNRDTSIQKSFALSYNQNFLKINYIGFSYKDPETIQYKYVMLGLDKDWTYTYNNTVQYTTLPPGEYKFVVRSMNKKGIWSESDASVTFRISPPFWETWWFLALTMLSVLLFSGLIIFLWIRNIKIKEQAKSEINRKIATIELQALRAQMNPHFMFNTMSSIQHYITTNETESALRYLSKFSKLMRKILDNSKTPTISVKDEIETLELYLTLESLRFRDKLNYTVEVDKSIDHNYDEIPAMLIQPYIENAIVHGINHKKTAGTISISLTRENQFIKCTITDDGIGRKAAEKINHSKNKKHTSAGMSITKERLAILNEAQGSSLNVDIKDLFDLNGNGCGTQVEIYIPCEN
ncbi:histidine kinase [Flavobacteriales bacterium]|nr:histidine kinase [Flavobacteriales bacterium]